MPRTKTLNKNQRLKSRKAIDALFKMGRSFSVFPFRVLYSIARRELLSEGLYSAPLSSHSFDFPVSTHKLPGILKTGFSAPSKNFKKAVDRNRIKRLTKEAFRLQQEPLNQVVETLKIKLDLFLIYTGKELPDQTLVTEKISVILQSLIKKLHESHP